MEESPDANSDLHSPEVNRLLDLINDSFRVRPNHDPIYVDLAGNLGRVSAPQHQVIYGRRGSGKSCLLVHHHRREAPNRQVLSVYLECDEVKRLGYPNILIRLLLTLYESLPHTKRNWVQRLLLRPRTRIERVIEELRGLLETPDTSDVIEEHGEKDQQGFQAQGQYPPLGASYQRGSTTSGSRRTAFTENKIDSLERHLQDYKSALSEALEKSRYRYATFILDDFYLIQPDNQPDVIDYIHRLLRGTDCYFKAGTVRHRTRLLRRNGQTVGLEESEDVEDINLDRTFEDTDGTRLYLEQMLNEMAESVGVNDATGTLLSREARHALVMSSGGVPRDYLNTFTLGVEAARSAGRSGWLTPTNVYKGASRALYRTKVKHLREEIGSESVRLESIYRDVISFCLEERRRTAFLVSQTEVPQFPEEYELIQQLMDYKMIHVIESDTSAASRRPGRYEAYTLDFALFMEPRRRNIEHVEFWKRDVEGRREGVREAPIYSLERARDVKNMGEHMDEELPASASEEDMGEE